MKFIKEIILLLSIVSLFLNPLYAQNIGSLKGTVKDEATGELLIGVNVYLQGTHIGNATDINGEYLIEQIPGGDHVLILSMINYQTVEHQFTITNGQALKFDFTLESDEYSFSDVVVTATRSEELVTSIPVSTEVLSSRKLAQLNAKNVGQALQSIGGALIKSYGTVGSLETLSLRGSTNSQVLILIDGQRLNDAQSGSVDLSSIPLDAVEKIEVVKGGHAALYGSDAVGGVINIITKSMAHKNELRFSASATTGSFGTNIFEASVGQGISNFDYFVSVNKTKSDGDFEYTDDTDTKVKMVNGDTEADNMFIKIGYLFPNSSRISAFSKYRFSNNGSPGSIDYPNATARNKVADWHTSISYEGLKFLNSVFNFNGYSIQNDHRYVNPESWMGYEDFYYQSRALGFTAQGFTDLNMIGLLSYGYEFRQDKLETDYNVDGVATPFLETQQRNVHSLYFQNDWQYEINHGWKATIIPAVRLDNYPEENVGSQFTPKVGFTLGYTGDWRGSIRGNVGKVFRAPSYNDLYWPEDSWTKGNPNLKPESGLTYDFGFIMQFKGMGSWSVEATYFASQLDDLILWAPADKWMPVNVASANTTGIESKVSWRGLQNILGVQLAYTYMNAKDDGDDPATNGKYLIYRPKDKFDAIMNLNYGIVSVNLNYSLVGKRFHDAANTTELDSYSVINTNVSLQPNLFGVDWLARFEVNNLADDELVITQGSPVPGREFRFTLGINGSFIN